MGCYLMLTAVQQTQNQKKIPSIEALSHADDSAVQQTQNQIKIPSIKILSHADDSPKNSNPEENHKQNNCKSCNADYVNVTRNRILVKVIIVQL